MFSNYELNDARKQKRPELANQKCIVLDHDNARPHTNVVTRQTLLKLWWDVLLHPPYSSDYYLFRTLQNDLNVKNFYC